MPQGAPRLILMKSFHRPLNGILPWEGGLEADDHSLWLVKYFFPRIVQDWSATLVLKYWFEETLTHIEHRMNLEHHWRKHWFSTIHFNHESVFCLYCRGTVRVSAGIFWPPSSVLLVPKRVTQSLSTGSVPCVTESSVDGYTYFLSGLLRPSLCTAERFFLLVSSLGSDWCGDVVYSEADHKLHRMSDRHFLCEWNHSSHSSYWFCAYPPSWWRYMKIRDAVNTESNPIPGMQWWPKVFKRRYGWKICCSIFVL